MHINGVVRDWKLERHERLELVVDLGFTPGVPVFQCEALVFTPDGTIVSALKPLNRSVSLELTTGEPFDFYIEAASNPDMSQGFSLRESPNGNRSTAGTGHISCYFSDELVVAPQLRDVSL